MPIYHQSKHKKKMIYKLSTFICILLAVVLTVQAQTGSESDDFSYPLKLYNQKFFDLAAQQFVRFYNSHPRSARVAEAKYYAGMSYFQLGDFARARVEFQSAAIEFPGSERAGESWFKTGQCYEEIGDPAEAAKAYETIRLLYPDHILAAEGLFRAGLIHLQRQNHDKAQSLLRIILDRYGSSAWYYPAMVKTAYLFYNLGDLQKAADLLNRVIEIKPDQESLAEAHLLLARIYSIQGDFSSARSNYQIMVNQHPNSEFYSSAILDLVKLLIKEADYTNAQKYITDGITHEKNKNLLSEMRYLLGDIYFLDQKYALALKEYEHMDVIADNETAKLIFLKRSLAKGKQNMISAALQDLSKVMEYIPEQDLPRQRSILELYLRWLERAGDRDAAIRLLTNQMSKSRVAEERIYFTLALVQFLEKEKRWHEIIQYLQGLMYLTDKYAQKDEVAYHLARSYEEEKNYSQSVYYYNLITTELNASEFYEKARDRLEYLSNHRMIDDSKALLKLAELFGHTLEEKDNSRIRFQLGKIYFHELKNYALAEAEFQKALQEDGSNSGDIHLYLGKTYLRMAEAAEMKGQHPDSYWIKANEQFKLAVANIATCSAPDEASWMRIKASLNLENQEPTREQALIEALIKNYPNSTFMEEWFRTLAYALAFEPAQHHTALTYFQKLVEQFKDSPMYSTYLFGYAQLIEPQNPDEALRNYKVIASEYATSPEAAQALATVAISYANDNKYNEAKILFNQLINTYYYSEIAAENQSRIIYTMLRAGSYDEVIGAVHDRLHAFYLDDLVLTREFFIEEDADQIYYLAKAYLSKGDLKSSLQYNQLYLNLYSTGKYNDHARFDIGKIYYDQNQRTIALDNFKLISPSNQELYQQAQLYIAEIYFNDGQYANAANMYKNLESLITEPAGAAEVQAKFIISRLREGQLQGINNLITQYAKKFPDQKNYRAQFQIEYGEYHRNKKEYNSAIKYYNVVKKNHKSSDYVDDADYYLALVYISQNKNEDAFKILSNFFTNYPKSDQLAAALNTLGTMYYRSERYDAAINMFKNALNACRDHQLEKNILSNLIQTYTMTSFWDAAQATARQYVDKFPEAEDNIDKKIVIAQAATNLNQFESAIDYLRKIKFEADSEREPEIQFYIGEAYLKAGQYESAIAEFVKIPLLSKKTKLQWEASALYYSGQSYEKLGRIDDAVRMYQEIVLRPGIDLVLKKEAEKRIKQIQ